MDRSEIERRLLEREEQLRADIGRELRKYDTEHYNMLADSVADRGEQSVADLLVDVDLAEISRDVNEIREIEQALLRLARGAYGRCVDCDAEIDAKRLDNDPSVARCIPCQERLESQAGAPKHHTM